METGDWGQILFFLAIIFISFLQWIVNKVRAKKAGEELEKEVEDLEFEFDESAGEPGEPGEPVSPWRRRRDEMRRFLEELAGETSSPLAPPVVTVPSPPELPPLHKRPKPKLEDSLTQPERAALHRVQERERTAVVSHHVSSPARSQALTLLRSPRQVRSAYILKEILDQPRGLKSFEEMTIL